MGAGEVPAAAAAGAARSFRDCFGLAKEKLGDLFGELELADAAHAVDQQGVRQSRQPLADGFEDRLVPGMHQSPASSRVIALRIVAWSPDHTFVVDGGEPPTQDEES
jgi:hypothetical protein